MKPVSFEIVDRVAVITVDNPPVNALSQPVREGIMNAVVQGDAAKEVDVITIICAGRTFFAGADVREFNLPPKEPELPDVVVRIESCEKPVIAAIHGTALGGGLETAMACHYRIAAKDASVGLPEVKLGLLPGASGTQRLPRLAGVERALDMMLSGKTISAQTALDYGVVDKLVERSELLDQAIAYARLLLEQGAGPRRVRDLKVESVDKNYFSEYKKKIAAKTRGQIAPERIIRCAEMSVSIPFDEAVQKERELFMECKASTQSAAMRYAFFAERTVAKVPGLGKDVHKREIQSVAVIGAGTMGAGIAYACLNAGFDVELLDNDNEGLQRGQKTVEDLYSAGVAKGRVTEKAKSDGLARLKVSQDYAALTNTDLVIEAVFENMDIKQEVFRQLDGACKPGAILATNTSTLSVDAIADVTNRPEDVIGLHFFSPAHVMRLIEVVRGANTSADVIASAMAFAKRLGKIGVVVGNCFGFVGNRMLYSYGRENQLMLLEGAPPEYIDRVLTDWGMAMGPNAVGDLAGLDVGYKIRRERTDLPDDPRFYRVADILAERGWYGQKTSRGMFLYKSGSRKPVPNPEVRDLIAGEAKILGIEQREIGESEIIDRCIHGLIVEGARILEENIAVRPSDIDVIWTNGYGFPRHRGGPMLYADTLGIKNVYKKVCEFHERFGPMYWQPPKLLKELAEQDGSLADLNNSK